MNCHRRRMPAVSPNAHKRAEGKREGNGVAKKGDRHGMEHRQVKLSPDWESAGRTVDWKK